MNETNIPSGGTTGVEVIRASLRDMPSSSGVYIMTDASGEVLYVGKARQLKARVSSYVNLRQLPLRLQRMVTATARLDINLTASEAEALLLEANLIKTKKPRYNILLRDDKSFPYIRLTGGHAYPRIEKYRGPREGAGDFFGPFASAGAVNEAIAFLQKAFLLRPCSDNVFKGRTRPCLQYQIRRCSAPCVKKISEENYAGLISQAKRFLSGKGREIQDALNAEMQAASDAMDYETAAHLRDRIRALTQVQQESAIAGSALEESDVLALTREGETVCVQVFSYRGGGNYGGRAYFPAHAEGREDAEVMAAFIGQYYQRVKPPRLVLAGIEPEETTVLEHALTILAGHAVEISVPARGERKKVMEQAVRNARESLARHLAESQHQQAMLERMAAQFVLEAPPARIEVYDNSHVMGTNAVGAMIVAGPEGFEKKSYRIYNIRSTELTPGDDYAMLREVLTRRFRKLLEAEDATRPDLVLIDGGAGHLSTAQAVFAQFGIDDVPLAAISKGPDRNAGREWFHVPGREAFQLPPGDALLHYLQNLRDEAHRFAIGAHRNRRSRSARTSELDAIAAIGPARKKALLRHFGSARAVGAASIADLEKVSGISGELAVKIYNHFHG